MIIYGTKGVHLKSERTREIMCNYCHQASTHNISIFGKYFYVYWIPFFPIGKKGLSECNNCKSTSEAKTMDAPLKRALDKIKSETKTPFTHWIGLIIAAVLFFALIVLPR